MNKIIIETPRLHLREMSEADVPFLYKMLSDPLVMRFYPRTLSLPECENWFSKQKIRYQDSGHGLWLVTEHLTNIPLGQAGLCYQPVEGKDYPEIGYMFYHTNWGKGFATESAIAIKEYAFNNLK